MFKIIKVKSFALVLIFYLAEIHVLRNAYFTNNYDGINLFMGLIGILIPIVFGFINAIYLGMLMPKKIKIPYSGAFLGMIFLYYIKMFFHDDTFINVLVVVNVLAMIISCLALFYANYSITAFEKTYPLIFHKWLDYEPLKPEKVFTDQFHKQLIIPFVMLFFGEYVPNYVYIIIVAAQLYLIHRALKVETLSLYIDIRTQKIVSLISCLLSIIIFMYTRYWFLGVVVLTASYYWYFSLKGYLDKKTFTEFCALNNIDIERI